MAVTTGDKIVASEVNVVSYKQEWNKSYTAGLLSGSETFETTFFRGDNQRVDIQLSSSGNSSTDYKFYKKNGGGTWDLIMQGNLNDESIAFQLVASDEGTNEYKLWIEIFAGFFNTTSFDSSTRHYNTAVYGRRIRVFNTNYNGYATYGTTLVTPTLVNRGRLGYD